jgi:hypothetical protein
MAEDVATRFEVPLTFDGSRGLTLTELFNILTTYGDGSAEYTVERASLESVFMKVIRENDIKEEGAHDDLCDRRDCRSWRLC